MQTSCDTSPQSIQGFWCQLMLLLICFLPPKDASSSASGSVRTSAWISFQQSSVSFFKDNVKAQGQKPRAICQEQNWPTGLEQQRLLTEARVSVCLGVSLHARDSCLYIFGERNPLSQLSSSTSPTLHFDDY